MHASYPASRDLRGELDDLTQSSHLNQQTVYETLERRYSRQLIYTSIGEILVAINPYKLLNIYDDNHIKMYQNRSDRSRPPPHVFRVAQQTYRAVTTNGRSENIVPIGLSGSGKTASIQLMIDYLNTVTPNSREFAQCKQIIFAGNRIMESFGNARTALNDNSSRFGKFLELIHSKNGEQIGGRISIIAMERSRISQLQNGESNFRIFYELIAGASQPMRERWDLPYGSISKFRWLGQSPFSMNDQEMAQGFNLFQKCLADIGIQDLDRWYLAEALAAILHLGNIRFGLSQSRSRPVFVEQDPSLDKAAALLGLSREQLTYSLTHRFAYVNGRMVTQETQNPNESNEIRNELGEIVYQMLFEFLISQTNVALNGNRCGSAPSINLCDIFGFENLSKNQFEQFCVNYLSEKIQQQMIQLVLNREQREYEVEDIKWIHIHYEDHKKTCSLLDNILRTLDEESGSSDSNNQFLNLLPSFDDNPNFQLGNGKTFIVQHWAGVVAYDASEFCSRNSEIHRRSLGELLNSSKSPLLKKLAGSTFKLNDRNEHKEKTFSTKMTEQLNRVLQKLASSPTTFVFCLKPNDRKIPDYFDRNFIVSQIEKMNLLQISQLKKEGYQNRISYQAFVPRFAVVMDTPPIPNKEGCKQMVKSMASRSRYIHIPLEEFAFGNQRIFIKTHTTLRKLEDFLSELVHKLEDERRRNGDHRRVLDQPKITDGLIIKRFEQPGKVQETKESERQKEKERIREIEKREKREKREKEKERDREEKKEREKERKERKEREKSEKKEEKLKQKVKDEEKRERHREEERKERKERKRKQTENEEIQLKIENPKNGPALPQFNLKRATNIERKKISQQRKTNRRSRPKISTSTSTHFQVENHIDISKFQLEIEEKRRILKESQILEKSLEEDEKKAENLKDREKDREIAESEDNNSPKSPEISPAQLPVLNAPVEKRMKKKGEAALLADANKYLSLPSSTRATNRRRGTISSMFAGRFFNLNST
eukprot:TRINITY_DN436_c1_g1_i2.p1 TRINITY_DN436_c1_g1~~TRINITY_DN436_c1_g1_i2.p1  ORF type:complete len:998 (-),score=369.57 TRINITY_DN436_c1_g1_i2:637-3630(-)